VFVSALAFVPLGIRELILKIQHLSSKLDLTQVNFHSNKHQLKINPPPSLEVKELKQETN